MKVWHPLSPAVYAAVEAAPASVLLEGSRAKESGSLSRLFLEPERVLEAHTGEELGDLFAQIEQVTRTGRCAAGFFSYECGEVFEPKVKAAAGASKHPLAWFGIYEREFRFDHKSGAFLDGDPTGLPAANIAESHAQAEPSGRVALDASLDEREYAERVHRIHEWIRAGDVYQLNLTFPLRGRIDERLSTVYARCRNRQPVDYGAFIHWQPGRRILCFSPELFFSIDEAGTVDGDFGRRITTRPMKGTAPRGCTTTNDREIAEWLRNDEKNRSENLMIVDLIRNDLGRLCEFGSVHVEDLFAVERYPTLWQMTSTVTGRLRADVGHHDVFRALFPCGSVTGAPKIRATQLLAEIESGPRGVYTGAIGFFSRERTVFNVAIRTLDLDGESATMGVGSGIVIDSTAEKEFRECRLKAEFLSKTEEPFSLVESLLWCEGYPLIELHLDRLADSADYFDFRFEREKAMDALLQASRGFSASEARKVRLLLDREGRLRIEHETVAEAAGASSGVTERVCIARERTDPGDRFLYHKTTYRPLYADACKAASGACFADVLFLNTLGEVTEGAIHNVFIEKGGRWITPPISCGLLPGVYRRHLLETRSNIEERSLTLDDLRSADAIYLTNAVRGVRRVILDETSAMH